MKAGSEVPQRLSSQTPIIKIDRGGLPQAVGIASICAENVKSKNVSFLNKHFLILKEK